jgi:hypothetical protein
MHFLSRVALWVSLILAADAQSTIRSWDEAAELAKATVSQLTREEKAGIATGIGSIDPGVHHEIALNREATDSFLHKSVSM